MKEDLDFSFNNEFSQEIYQETYKFGEDKNISGTFRRIAKSIAEVEKGNCEYYEKLFFEMFNKFQFLPGGRIISNAGTGLKGATLINCFVDGFRGENQDSWENIADTLKRQGLILKSEGGYGFCVDVLRPKGAFIKGIGGESPGAVKMLEMWNTQAEVITAGSGRKSKNKKVKQKVRKGTQMVTMSIWHPDIEDFIKAKQQKNYLTKFNMSVLVTDEFIEAVLENKSWELFFPDYENSSEIYRKEWKGNGIDWKDKNHPIKIYKKYKDANELWDLIMKSTYNRNEPGVLFIDTINRLNNLYYCEHINATNPCGEQVLPNGGSCLLSSINLTQFIDFENKDWDYKKLKEIIPTIIRFMDNVIEKTYLPLDYQKEELLSKRRIGLGVMGYGSSLMMLRLRYGGKEALEKTKKLMKFIINQAYQASALLAKEKGTFPLYNKEKYLEGEFIKRLEPETLDLIKQFGIRNSHLISIQPTGNTSILANNISGGLEPVFLASYIRTSSVNYIPKGLNIPENINWEEKNFGELQNNWEWFEEGDETFLKTIFQKYVYKLDKNRGLTKENLVEDFGVKFLKEKNLWDEKASWTKTTNELYIEDHLTTLNTFAEYIDSSMSKTINLPKNYGYSAFKNVYLKAHNSKIIKGITTYREGTMASVLSKVENEQERKIVKLPISSFERPKELICDIHHIIAGKKDWIVLVGLLSGDPYEIFAFKKKWIKIPERISKGKTIKVNKGNYSLVVDSDIEIENITELFERDEEEALTRQISLSLRKGISPLEIVDQLNKAEGTIINFSKIIARVLRKYLTTSLNTTCPECKKEGGLVKEENCLKCKFCGYSACS